MDIHTKLMNALREGRTIPEIERSITLEREQLEADRRGLAHIVEQIAAVGDAEKTIQDWRIQMARLSRPSVLVPKHLLEAQRQLQAHTATRAALLESIATREERIRSLEAERERALSDNYKAVWSIVCDRAAEVAKDVETAATAYKEASTRLMALYCARMDMAEHFPELTQRVLAPLPNDTLKRPYDLPMMGHEERRLTDQAREWRQALASDATAAAPF